MVLCVLRGSNARMSEQVRGTDKMRIITLSVGSIDTNCYIVIHNGDACVIDPGAEANGIIAVLAGQQVALQNILLTHGHADHVAAAVALKRLTGAKLFAHPADGYLLRATDNEIAKMLGLTEAVTPDAALQDSATVSLAGVDFTVLATPGHTPGSCCLYSAAEQVLFSGDTLFRGGIGRSDLPGGDAKVLARSLARLKQLPPDTEVYPGHGPSTTIGRERMSNRYW